jgi:hypothetical protein
LGDHGARLGVVGFEEVLDERVATRRHERLLAPAGLAMIVGQSRRKLRLNIVPKVAVFVLLLAMPGFGCAALATTLAPCSARIASAPSIDLVSSGTGEEGTTTTLSGAGQIGGCPPVGTTTPESVSITVCLQHYENRWRDHACSQTTKGWDRYVRLAREAGLTVTTRCVAGEWRTDVRGGDGWPPFEWSSEVATFTCAETKGGD